MRRFPLRALGDRRGSVTILAAAGMTMMLAATALAVDVGSIYLAGRRLQGVADAAALAASSDIANPSAAANAAIAANADGNSMLAASITGSYAPDASVAASQRFVPGAAPANAAQVTVTQDVPLFFGRFVTGAATSRIAMHATAARMDFAAFSIGSRLAAVQGGLPGAILSGLAGTSLNLSVMDYNSLVGANVDILAFSDALRTQLNLSAATFGKTLNTIVTLPQALTALAAVTHDAAAAASLRSIALKVPPTTIRLSDLIDLGPYADQDHVDPDSAVNVDGYSVLREMLALSNGQRQVALDLGLSLPGLASSRLTLAIGQRPAHSPWLAVAKDDSVVVRTAQTRLYIDTQIGGAATLGLLSLRLPIYVELAQAQVKLSAISCQEGAANATVTLKVLPAVGEVAIADINMAAFGNFAAPLTENRAIIAHTLLLDVTGKASVTLGGVDWQSSSFSGSEIAAGAVHTLSTGDLTQGIASSLVNRIDLRAGPLNLSPLTAIVGAALTPVAPVLDGIVDQLTGLLGIHVGQADVRVDGVRCGKPTLVG